MRLIRHLFDVILSDSAEFEVENLERFHEKVEKKGRKVKEKGFRVGNTEERVHSIEGPLRIEINACAADLTFILRHFA